MINRDRASAQPLPRALVVDDEALVRDLLAEILHMDGFDVQVADSAEDALGILAACGFEIVISDLRMPGLGGLHLLTEVKRIDPTTGVVIMTGFGDMATSVEALRLGVDDFLNKPIHVSELRRIVARTVERGRLLRENQRQQVRLEQLYLAKSRFLANMSHELRTPLTTIIGMSEVLDEGVFGELVPKQRRYVGSIRDSARQLLNIINDILDYSDIEAGSMRMEIAPFSPEEAMQAAASLVESAAAARSTQIQLAPCVHTKTASGDRQRVVQILVNLVSNAIKFSPVGSTIHLRCEVGRGALRFIVEDPGAGIAPGSLDAIFEEFQQAGLSSSGKPPGTGLGLALSRKLAHKHGGDILVASVFGLGSTFTFVLPHEPATAVAADEACDRALATYAAQL